MEDGEGVASLESLGVSGIGTDPGAGRLTLQTRDIKGRQMIIGETGPSVWMCTGMYRICSVCCGCSGTSQGPDPGAGR